MPVFLEMGKIAPLGGGEGEQGEEARGVTGGR